MITRAECHCSRGYLAAGGRTGLPGGRNGKTVERNHAGHSSIKHNLAHTPDGAQLGRPAASSLDPQDIDVRTTRGPSPAVPTTWTVNSLADSQPQRQPTPGTLRWAITQANDNTMPENNTINFAVTGTITLNSALPVSNTTGVTDIEGPGASSLTVARQQRLGDARFQCFRCRFQRDGQPHGLNRLGRRVRQRRRHR